MITTERLIIRKLTLQDADQIQQLVNSPGWLTHIGERHVCDAESAKKYIQSWAFNTYEKNGFGPYAVLVDQVFIGICGLFQREYLDFPDLGFAFLPDYMGKGYGFESSKAIMNYARTLGYNTLAGITSKENVASQNLLKKLGFAELSHPKVKDSLYYEYDLTINES